MKVNYFSGRALRLHLTLAVLLPAFGALFWWQLHRALDGNGLSWAYTVEWPLFAGYAVFLWWRLLHEDLPMPARRNRPAPPADADLAAYNAYLASLRAADEGEEPAPAPPIAAAGAAEATPTGEGEGVVEPPRR